MKNLKTFESFSEKDEIALHTINEGLFDKLSTLFTKVTNFFSEPDKLRKGVDAALTDAGDKAKKFTPKIAKTSETYMVVMGDGKNSAADFSIAFSKLADLPDGSGLFQIAGTTSNEMLKALTGTEINEDLAKNNVMAIISPNGFEKGKVATMRLLKNITPGKDYVTKSLVQGAVPALEVEKKLANLK
jgi:hypothetical protein